MDGRKGRGRRCLQRVICGFGLPFFLAAGVFGSGSVTEPELPFDRGIVDAHRQLYGFSCIPSSVEIVLKLTRRVPLTFHGLQHEWRDKTDGCFDHFDGRTIAGVTFHRKYAMTRCAMFPFKGLFAAVDAELAEGRPVIVGLENDNHDGYHNWVIVEKLPDGEYRAWSKAWFQTIELTDVKRRIIEMGGTDIGTYTCANAGG
jgi:hypothetical protein